VFFEKNRPKCGSNKFHKKLQTTIFRRNKQPKNFGYFKKLPKVNHCPLGKDSPNLVTLMAML
jgi:hypothetical protein